MSEYLVRYAPEPKPAHQSVTLRAAAISVLPVAFKLSRERPSLGDLVTIASAAGVAYGSCVRALGSR
jgi:hypothetical protein